MENSMAASQKVTRRIVIWSSHPASRHSHTGTGSGNLNRYLDRKVRTGITHNSQKVERTQASRWVGARAHTHTRWNLFSLKKEGESNTLQCGWTLKTFCSMKSPRHKRTNTVRFCIYQVFRKIQLIEKETRMVGPGGGGGGWRMFNGYKAFL